ncbi:uncharacterized protein LOC18439074 isoform X1 [Amborella trichopoda]|uniref:uncharacterized protein LOC18439074 isoform X1 n=1 Tax=Amborella trichopoda TaxID=13333 RepID=UPI0005D41AD0|nr:uncharacterized protein LOC18439074 isoform X1 [Amborella trichopoda]|eukprot:XP_011625211.1 uncharacterized protein LOC18439074 isoform X1 [Amborella trichopoda]
MMGEGGRGDGEVAANHSDKLTPAEQQVSAVEQVRTHFDSIAPWRPRKPNRSEPESLTPAEQQMSAMQQVRTHFESIAPRRPRKPNRSEPDSSDQGEEDEEQYLFVPELHKLQALKSLSQPVCLENWSLLEEFVKTGYYEELNSVDKQHHTIGKGFIRVEEDGNRRGFFQLGGSTTEASRAIRVRSNPATNDWIPNHDEEERVPTSTKPGRSEG